MPTFLVARPADQFGALDLPETNSATEISKSEYFHVGGMEACAVDVTQARYVCCRHRGSDTRTFWS